MRIVIGEDEALLRAGLSHVLERGGFDVVAAAAMRTSSSRPSSSPAGAAGYRHPDAAFAHRRGTKGGAGHPRESPTLPVVVLSQHLQRRYAIELLAQPTAGVGTCSSSASVTSTRSATTYAGCVTARPYSIPR